MYLFFTFLESGPCHDSRVLKCCHVQIQVKVQGLCDSAARELITQTE